MKSPDTFAAPSTAPQCALHTEWGIMRMQLIDIYISGLFTFSQLHWEIVRQSERERDREGLHPDLFWIERGWHPVCPTICVMFLASHQALLSGNSARRLMCAGGAAEYSANSAQQIWILCHMTAPKGVEKPQHVTAPLTSFQTKTHTQKSGHTFSWCFLMSACQILSAFTVNMKSALCISLQMWIDNFLVISSLKHRGPCASYFVRLSCSARLND